MDKLFILTLCAAAAVAAASAGPFDGDKFNNRNARIHKMMNGHRGHMNKWFNQFINAMMRMNPLQAEAALAKENCYVQQTSFPKPSSEEQANLWPVFFAYVKNKDACRAECLRQAWGCGGYLVADGKSGSTKCIVYLRSRAGEMGYKMPSKMTSKAQFYEIQCQGKFLSNDMMFKKVGKMILMRRMPFMLAKVPGILRGIKMRLGLADPKREKRNPFTKGNGPQGGLPIPPPSGDPNVGTPAMGPPDQAIKATGTGSNDDSVYKPMPGEEVSQGVVDAPEKPKAGPNGEPAGWTPGQKEEGQGWKRSQDVDPELAGPGGQANTKQKKQLKRKNNDADAF